MLLGRLALPRLAGAEENDYDLECQGRRLRYGNHHVPERVIEAGLKTVQISKHLLDELKQIVEHATAEPELVH